MVYSFIKLWLAVPVDSVSEMSLLVTALIGFVLCMNEQGPLSDYDMKVFYGSWYWNSVDCGSKTMSEMYLVGC